MNFQKLIDTISDAFSIFDFSYIISGGLTFLIILYDLHYHHIDFMLENITITIVCGIFLSYICGIFSWLCGKTIRRTCCNIDKDFEKTFKETTNSITENIDFYMTIPNNNSLRYEYMWICLCKEEKAKPHINFIHRFWVMQAVYEGLIFTLIIAFIVLLDVKIIDCSFVKWFQVNTCFWERFKFIGALILLVGLIYLCGKEAKSCARNQIREVILSYYLYCYKNNKENKDTTIS